MVTLTKLIETLRSSIEWFEREELYEQGYNDGFESGRAGYSRE